MANAHVLKASETEHVEAEWGRLTWYASALLGNSADMTVGRCVIAPGKENPCHSHPNCSEVLVVVDGEIAHSLGDGTDATMRAGDVITIPANVPHNARNIGDTDAVLFIAFSSADRQAKGE